MKITSLVQIIRPLKPFQQSHELIANFAQVPHSLLTFILHIFTSVRSPTGNTCWTFEKQ